MSPVRRLGRKTTAIVLGTICGAGVSVGWVLGDGSLFKAIVNGLLIIVLTILFAGNSGEQ